MPLQGTFDILDFTEVLRLLSRHQLTGRLHVRHRSFGANLFIEDGQLTGADQSEHQAAANSGDVRGRLEEICFEMLDAERGSFEFQPGKPSALPVTTRHRVDTVLNQARKRLTQWRELQEAIPSLDLQPRLLGDLGQAEVTIDKEGWRVLTVIDGRRNLHAIGRLVNVSDFDVCRIVARLLDDGIIELEGLASLSAASRDAIPTVPALAERPTPGGAARVGPAAAKAAAKAAVTRTGTTRAGSAAAKAAPTDNDTTGAGATGAGDGLPAPIASPAPSSATDAGGTAPADAPADRETPAGGAPAAHEAPSAGRRNRLVRIRSRQAGGDPA